MILLDINVVSELAKPAPDPAVAAWIACQPDEDLQLSVLTLGEIKKGADLLDPGPRRERIEHWLSGLAKGFGDRILPVDRAIALQWGTIVANGRRTGRARPPIDSLLAATAICHGLMLATRNVKDFEGTGAVVVNPWEFHRAQNP